MGSRSKGVKRASTVGALATGYPLAPEKNRALCGDWNFESSEMPIDLVHGGQVVRPLSDEEATAPKGEK
eukprot:5708778-Amphidinium_carterae.1